jgi:hypothetical protein
MTWTALVVVAGTVVLVAYLCVRLSRPIGHDTSGRRDRDGAWPMKVRRASD